MNLVGPLDINYCIYFNLLSIIGVLLCISSLLFVIIYPKKWIYIIYFTIIYLMVYFQNRLLFNMCASKKESLVTFDQIGAVIDNLIFFVGDDVYNSYIKNLFDSSVALLSSSKGDVEDMVKVIYFMKKDLLATTSEINLSSIFNTIADVKDVDTALSLNNLKTKGTTTEAIVMKYFNDILHMVKKTIVSNKNIGNMLNFVIDLIYEINSKQQLKNSASMPYDVMNALKVNGNTWSDYYPTITSTLNLIDHKLNTIKTNTTPLSYTQTDRPVNFKNNV